MLIFMGKKRAEKKGRKYHQIYQITFFLIQLNAELSPFAASAASFLMIFFNSVSNSVVHLLWLDADFRNRKNKVGRE